MAGLRSMCLTRNISTPRAGSRTAGRSCFYRGSCASSLFHAGISPGARCWSGKPRGGCGRDSTVSCIPCGRTMISAISISCSIKSATGYAALFIIARTTSRTPSASLPRLHNFDAVILMSETQRPFFLEAGVPDAKIHVVLHGVDTEFFVPGPPAALASFTAISVGGFRRNFPLLRKVCERLAEAHGTFVSKLSHRNPSATIFSDLGNVDFLSGLNDAELLPPTSPPPACCTPPKTRPRTMPCWRAWRAGSRSSPSAWAGIPEYVDSESALLVEPGNDGTLAGAVRELAQSAAHYSTMRIEARKHAETLAWPRVAERMTKIYENLWA